MKMRYLLLCFFSAALFSNVSAQDLPRRISLGVNISGVSPEDAQRLKYTGTGGALVKGVLPNSTATNLGIQEDDILLETAGIPIGPGFYQQLKDKVRADDPLEILVFRDGKEQRLAGKAKGAPKETLEKGEVIYDAVPFQEGLLRSIILKPEGEGPFPAIFYVQGYSCVSVEQIGANSSVKQLLDGFVEQGYIVYRIEKLGMGDSYGTEACTEIEVELEIEAFRAGFDQLSKYPDVDKDNIFLWGHSLGAFQAPYIAKGKSVKGIIGFGYTAKKWHDYLFDIVGLQLPILGVGTHGDMVAVMDSIRQPLYDFFYKGVDISNLQNTYPAEFKALQGVLSFNPQGVFGRSPNFLRSLNELSLFTIHQEIQVPTLALHGSSDLAAIGGEHTLPVLAEAINEVAPGKGFYQLVPKTNHYLGRCDSRKASAQLHQSGQMGQHASAHFNPDLVSITHEWIQDMMNKE